jgi:branched-chain amino acid transport system substrate-binding protein
MRSRLSILPCVVLAGALAGCSGSAEPAPVLIGHVAAAQDRDDGGPPARGIRLAVLEANKDPARGAGRPVKVIHTDTLGRLDAFEAEAVRLARVNRVAALLGGTTADEAERLETAGVPVVSPCGMPPRSSRADAAFYTGLSPARRGQVLARFAAEELQATRAAVLADEQHEDSVLLAEAFARAFPDAAAKKSKGDAPRARVIRYGKDPSFRELATQVKEEKPAVLLLAGPPGDLRRLRKELADAKLPVLFGGEDVGSKCSAEGREGLDGAWLVTAFAPDVEEPRAKEFVKKYRETFGEEPDVQAALAYEDARLLFEALRRAKDNPGGAALREELARLKDFPGLTGLLTFGEDRRLRRPALVVRVEGNQARTVKRYGPDE